jgi:hypothetical protein
MKNVFFTPFIGEYYQNRGFDGKKILVLGESHYCGGCDKCGSLQNDDEECRELTTAVVNKFFAYKKGRANHESWMRTLTRFTNVLCGEHIENKMVIDFWNSILFYNYVQSASIGEPRNSPKEEDFSNSETAFFEVLNEFQPDLIIVWGERLWNKMPGNGHWGNEVLDGKYGKVYYYSARSKDIPAFYVYHPSSSAFSYDYTPYLQAFVNDITSK